EDYEAGRVPAPAVALQGQELPPPPQPDSPRVGAGCGRHGSPRLFRGDGDGQPLPTLGAAPLQHVPPVRCGPACPGPVRALSPPVARLVRPLHREPSLNHAPSTKSILDLPSSCPGMTSSRARSLHGPGHPAPTPARA